MIPDIAKAIRSRLRELDAEGYSIEREAQSDFLFVGKAEEQRFHFAPQAVFSSGAFGPFLLDRRQDEKDLRKSLFLSDKAFTFRFSFGRFIHFSEDTAENDVRAFIESLEAPVEKDSAESLAEEVFSEGHGYHLCLRFAQRMREELPSHFNRVFDLHIGWEIDAGYLAVLAILKAIASASLLDSPIGETRYFGGKAK